MRFNEDGFRMSGAPDRLGNAGRIIRRLVSSVLVALAVGATSGSAPVAFAGTKPTSPPPKPNVVTFGTQTASATQPDSRGFYNIGATAGGQVLYHVALRNYSTQAITVALKGTDAENDANGDLVFRPINQQSVDLGQWIEVRRSDLNVTVPPRSNVIIPFLVVVPKDATPGDHVGGITASLESSVVSKSSHGSRVKLLQTVGSEIFVRVSGPLRPHLTVGHLSATYAGTTDPIGTGVVKVTYRVANDGNVALGGVQTVYVAGLFGQKNFALHIKNLPLLLPGNSAPEVTIIRNVYPELYDSAHVSVRPLPLAGAVTPPLKTVSASVSFWAVPWTALSIVAAVLMGIAAALLIRRRRRRPGGADAGAGPVAPGAGPTHKVEAPSPEPPGRESRAEWGPAEESDPAPVPTPATGPTELKEIVQK